MTQRRSAVKQSKKKPPVAGGLGNEQIAEYWKHGFVVVPGLVSQGKLDRYVQRLEAIVSGDVAPADGMLVMRDVMVAKGAVAPSTRMAGIAKIQDFEQDPELYSYALEPALLDCVESLIGREVLSIHTMLINKPPGVDGRHPLHQDLFYFPFRPADAIVATWTAINPCRENNGCLFAVPGSHKGKLREHGDPGWEYVNLLYWEAKREAGETDFPEPVPLIMHPGDTVLFHPLLLHGSGVNQTNGFRRSISAHYASDDCYAVWTNEVFGERKYVAVRGARQGQRVDIKNYAREAGDRTE
jgi:phytanoyl-CoA hydroxylase